MRHGLDLFQEQNCFGACIKDMALGDAKQLFPIFDSVV